MAESAQKVRVRFAPSPTGSLHIGGARTALFNWLFARQHEGVFVLRIEDTDTSRSEKRHEDEILEGLRWVGLSWDEGPYRQSDRLSAYRTHLEKLLAEKKAYYCYCSKEDLEAERQVMQAQGLPPKYGGHCRSFDAPPAGKNPEAIRFKMPEAKVEFKDMIRGKVQFDASLFGDVIIAKNLDTPLYNFAVVVDDADMKITHVIRGEEHLSNTPKQILLQKALGLPQPEYAHIPLILNPDKSKMSKRFSDTALLSYRAKGYLPSAILNFLLLLGWHPKDNREIFMRDEMAGAFDLQRVQKAGAVFNEEKLDWLNKEHLKIIETEEIAKQLQPFLTEKHVKASKEFLWKVIEAARGRAATLKEILELSGFLFELPEYDADLLRWKDASLPGAKIVLEEVQKIFNLIADDRPETVSEGLAVLINKEGKGGVLWPLRVALSGQKTSPDPLEIVSILGLVESRRRIDIAIRKISAYSIL